MTARIRSDELPMLTTTLRHTGELLAHPCRCPRVGCTIGDHVWRSTRDMGPGPRAANLDPNSRGWRWEQDDGGNVWPIPNDVTGESAVDPEPADAHVEYMTLLNEAMHAAARLATFVDRHRPDRHVPLPDDPSSDQWCRNCLTHGICNPRHRGDACRACYDFHLAYPTLQRPGSLVRAQHEGRKLTQQMVDTAVREARSQLRSKRKRRRAG